MIWVNGASKRMQVKQEKKKKKLSNKEQVGDAQRQFFSSERRAKLLKTAGSMTVGADRMAIKSFDVQGLSMPVITEERREILNPPPPVFFAPKAKGQGAPREEDASFDKPLFFNSKGEPSAKSATEKKAKVLFDFDAAAATTIRFIDNGKDVTDRVLRRE
jgi:hypothetical protein